MRQEKRCQNLLKIENHIKNNYFSFEKNIKIMTWNNITYRQLLDIREASNIEDENERVYGIMAAIFGEDVLDLPLKEFNEKCKELQFLQKPVPNDLHVKNIKVNGREYYFDGLLGKITTAQYIDFQNYQKNEDEQKIFSVFIIPKGHKYNDGYDMDQVFNDILDVPVPILFSASFFFIRQFELFIKIFRRYSIKQMKKTGLPKEVMENLEKVVNLSTTMMITPLESFRS